MKKKTLKLKTLPASIHSLEKFVEDICDENNINNTYFGNILITLTEAMENALYHGNKSDEQKNITISFESRPKGLLFEISDEGTGFDFNNIPDATDVVGNPERKGTGLFLIRTLADEVKFKNNGSTIQIMFHVASINQQMASERMFLLNTFKTAKKGIKSSGA
jgi:serine/threonine-protein kinase RsbW